MKIKKVGELNEKFEKNDKIQNLKKLLEEVYGEGVDAVEYDELEGYSSTLFNTWWDKHGDEIIIKYDILETKKSGNIRGILPQMVSLSNNSRITLDVSQSIVDKFSSSELQDFKRWLQLIDLKMMIK